MTRGRREDFAEFYAGAWPRVLRILVAVADEVEDAEDALQEAFARTYSRWARVRAYDDPEAFTRLVAMNLLRDGGRRRRTAREGREVLTAGAAEAPPGETRVLVVAALRSLPPPQREVLALHYLLDMSVDAVAAELSRPVGTVKAQLARGRTRVASILNEGATR